MPRNGASTRTRILETAERLVIENGFAATSLDRVIAESRSSKGAFFHHFEGKARLGEVLVRRYADADVGHLRAALKATAGVVDPRERLIAFLRVFEDEGDALMSEQSSCLYAALMVERQLADGAAGTVIEQAVVTWRHQVAALFSAAFVVHPSQGAPSPEDWADHLFVTFEGAFILCRTTGDPSHMRRQLSVFRASVEALLRN